MRLDDGENRGRVEIEGNGECFFFRGGLRRRRGAAFGITPVGNLCKLCSKNSEVGAECFFLGSVVWFLMLIAS